MISVRQRSELLQPRSTAVDTLNTGLHHAFERPLQSTYDQYWAAAAEAAAYSRSEVLLMTLTQCTQLIYRVAQKNGATISLQILEPYAAPAAPPPPVFFATPPPPTENASARCRRRRFRGRRAAVKVSDPISFSGENLHAAYNF